MDDVIDKHVANDLIEHASRIEGGKNGYLDFTRTFLAANPTSQFEIVRSIVDGDFVFLHVHHFVPDSDESQIIADIFEIDKNHLLVEHWQVIQQDVQETVSGHSMTGGVATITDLDKTEENRRLITAFMDEILIGEQLPRAPEFISEDLYIQHNPTVDDGLTGLFKHYQEFIDNGIKAKYQKAYKILVQGNFAITYSSLTLNEDKWCYVDIFRMHEGKTVEHWDIQEEILPREQWLNAGMF